MRFPPGLWRRSSGPAALVVAVALAGCSASQTASGSKPSTTAAVASAPTTGATLPPTTVSPTAGPPASTLPANTLSPSTVPPSTLPANAVPPSTLAANTLPATTVAATPPPAAGPATAPSPAAASAAAVLATLAVKGRAPERGYSRAAFGPAWADVDHNGCDTRDDILARDLVGLSFRAGTGNCIVASGTLHDPYTGQTVAFTRGVDTSDEVQIDHIVALADAWQTGAQSWSSGERKAFANDPLELQATLGSVNDQKGDGDAATWLPPNTAFRCTYVARQIAVKHKYGLWLTPPEKAAMVRVLGTCPGEPLPEGSNAPVATVPPPSPTQPAPPATAAPSPSPATVPPATAAPFPSPVTVPPATVPPPVTGGSAPPVDAYDCPPSAPIKGNESSHLYHLPGGATYGETKPEVCFATPADAERAGYRAALR